MNSLDMSPELKDAWIKATQKQSNVRYLKIKINDEKLELIGTGNTGTTSLDFNSFSRNTNADEPFFLAFRYKDSFAEGPWAFIMFTPDSLQVKEKTLYTTSFLAARDALGAKLISKLKRYSIPTDFKWIQFVNSESDSLQTFKASSSYPAGGSSRTTPQRSTPHSTPQSPPAKSISQSTPQSPPSSIHHSSSSDLSNSNSANFNNSNSKSVSGPEEKPWSERELMLQELAREEELARKEMEQRAVPVIGLAQVAFPLSEQLIEAINNLQNGQHNWVQVTLNNPPTQLDLVECKTLTEESELISAVDPKNPQFYIYNRFNESIVVIYCCPEQVKGEQSFAQARQSRMIYATAKSSLFDGLSGLNLNLPLKKYDIDTPNELEESTLNVHLLSKASDIKNAKLLQGSNSYSSPSAGRGYKVGGGHPANLGPSLASVLLNNPATRKPVPKGVVLPPKGAHC